MGLGAIAGGLLYLKTMVAENAVLRDSVVAATEYSLRLVDEVEAYSVAVRILGERDQQARDNRDDKFKSIENRDLQKMSKRHPDNLLNILNARTERLLRSLETDNSSRDAKADGTHKTGVN